MLKGVLKNLFDIREGEFKRSVLMQTIIFLIICTLLILKPNVNALFIARFGVENLPLAYIFTALFAAMVTTLYSRWLRRIDFNRLVRYCFASFIVTLLGFGFCLYFSIAESLTLYLFYLWVSIFALLAASQFWILANQVFQIREAKRIFSFIGAGAIAGGLVGGFLTTILAPIVGSEVLVLLCALLLCIVLPLIRIIQREIPKSIPQQTAKREATIRPRSAWAEIKDSQHLRFLAIVIGLSVFVSKLVDYQFSAVASEYYPDPDELAAFFGFWVLIINIGSLLIQLFLTKKIVGMLGVGWSLFLMPFAILLGALGLFFFPELWVVILLKFNEGSFKQSIHKAATELLSLPIPTPIKQKTKTFIDVFVDSIATGLSGLVLIFVIKGLDIPPKYINLVMIVVLLLWVFYASKLRKEYLFSLQQKLQQLNPTHKKTKVQATTSSNLIERLAKVLSNGNEAQILYVLKKIDELNETRFGPQITLLLQHPSLAVRRQSLRYFYDHPMQIEESNLLECLTQNDLAIKTEAFAILLQKKHAQADTLLLLIDQSPDLSHRASLLLSLARESRGNPSLQDRYQILARLEAILGSQEAHESAEVFEIVYQIIGWAQLKTHYQRLVQAFSEGGLTEGLVLGAIMSRDEALADQLLKKLGLENKVLLYEHLPKMGGVLLLRIQHFLRHDQFEAQVILLIPPLLARFAERQAREMLLGLLEHPNLNLRLSAIKGLEAQKNRFKLDKAPHKLIRTIILQESDHYRHLLLALYYQQSRPLSSPTQESEQAKESLIELLKRRQEGSMQRIFGLLSLQYEEQELQKVYRSFQQKELSELRQEALEYLDNLLHPSLKKLLMPLIESALLEDGYETIIQQIIPPDGNANRSYEALLRSKDYRLKLALLHLLSFEPARYQALFKLANQDIDPRITRYTAQLRLRLN